MIKAVKKWNRLIFKDSQYLLLEILKAILDKYLSRLSQFIVNLVLTQTARVENFLIS